MPEYTPTTEQVRRDYAAHRDEDMFPPTIEKARAFRESGGGAGEFDRWLAAHDREVAAREHRCGYEDAIRWVYMNADRDPEVLAQFMVGYKPPAALRSGTEGSGQ